MAPGPKPDLSEASSQRSDIRISQQQQSLLKGPPLNQEIPDEKAANDPRSVEKLPILSTNRDADIENQVRSNEEKRTQNVNNQIKLQEPSDQKTFRAEVGVNILETRLQQEDNRQLREEDEPISHRSSSCNQDQENLEECGVCYGEYPVDDIVVTDCCQNKYCLNCTESHIRQKVIEGHLDVLCLQALCKKIIQEKTILLISEKLEKKKQKEIKKSGSATEKSLIQFYREKKQAKDIQQNPNLLPCPAPNCTGYLDKKKVIKGKATCSREECRQESTVCVKCNPAHTGECSTPDSGHLYTACPKCGMKFERMGGCSNLRCNACNFMWCGVCKLGSNHWFHMIQIGGMNCQLLNIILYEVKVNFFFKCVLFLVMLGLSPVFLAILMLIVGCFAMYEALKGSIEKFKQNPLNNFVMAKEPESESDASPSFSDRLRSIRDSLAFLLLWILVIVLGLLLGCIIYPFALAFLEFSLVLVAFRMIYLWWSNNLDNINLSKIDDNQDVPQKAVQIASARTKISPMGVPESDQRQIQVQARSNHPSIEEKNPRMSSLVSQDVGVKANTDRNTGGLPPIRLSQNQIQPIPNQDKEPQLIFPIQEPEGEDKAPRPSSRESDSSSGSEKALISSDQRAEDS